MVALEHAQIDDREARARQVVRHAPHVIRGPDAILVSGRDGGARPKRTEAGRHDVAMQHGERGELAIARRDVRSDAPADGEADGEHARGVDTDARSSHHLAYALHHVAIIFGYFVRSLPDRP